MPSKCNGPIPAGSAIVKPVDPDDPDVADVVAEWKKTPGTVGIRIMMPKEAKRDPSHPGHRPHRTRGCSLTIFRSTCCAGAIWTPALRSSIAIPNTRFILDHLGILQPRTPPAPAEPWADLPKVLELAKRPNAVIKVSGACTLSQRAVSVSRISGTRWPGVFDAWGFDRCLWGTDWTRAFAVVNYAQAVEPFVKTEPPER